MRKKPTPYYIKLKRIIQPRNFNRNRAALEALCGLDFNMPAIRHAILALNKIKSKDIINGHKISRPSVYNTLSGIRDNELVKRLVAESLNLHISELWPDQQKDDAA